MSDETFDKLFQPKPLIVCGILFIATAAILYFQGRVWWCQAGDYSPWSCLAILLSFPAGGFDLGLVLDGQFS